MKPQSEADMVKFAQLIAARTNEFTENKNYRALAKVRRINCV